MSVPSSAERPASILRRIDGRALALYCAVLAFFFVSGGCGLLYQVVWTRKLVLLFGTTSYAVSTVLGIFFAGLGLGSLIGGRIADRTKRPLFIYGAFEIVIGIWALIFILLIDAGDTLAASMLGSTSADRVTGIILRGGFAAVYLIIPVTLMGATLPLLAKYASGEMAVRGRRIGALYSINTFGAVAGTMAAGFLLIPAIGYTQTTLIGAAANGIVGLFGMYIGRKQMDVHDIVRHTGDAPLDALHAGEGSRRTVWITTAAFAISGFCAIALEVMWTRLLVLVFAGTTYAYTTMLASMLCGIALGSAIVAPFADRVRRPLAWFGFILILNAAACVAMLGVFAGLPERFADWASSAGYDWDAMLRVKFLLSFMSLLLPTCLFGMGFPFAVRAATATQGAVGRDVGRLYGANTFAGVAGAVAGGFLLIPALGTHNGILALSALLALAGILALAACPASAAVRKIVMGGAAAAACIGAYITTPNDVSQTLNLSYLPEGEELIDYREGVEGTVAVSQPRIFTDGTSRTIYINRVQATATIEKGLKMNRFQGVLPFIFDRQFQNALFMCFGSGSTLGTLAQWPFEYIDAVEISPDVLAFGSYFKQDNLDVLNNPKVRFHIDDGRNYLLTTDKEYDLISFEPMPLALAGVSTFYTQEYYELCMDHLAPGGLVSQWIPLHSLNMDIVRSLTRTFTSVFPYYSAWFINADLFLIGSNEPLGIDYSLVSQRVNVPRIQSALKPVGLNDTVELINLFCMGQDTIDRFAEGGTIMHDDLPWAEFIAPKIMHTYRVDEALKELKPYIEPAGDLVYFENMSPDAAKDAEAALAKRFKSRQAGFEGLIAYRQSGLLADPEEDFMKALRIDRNNLYAKYYLRDILIQKIHQFRQWGDEDFIDESIVDLKEAIQLVPKEPLYHIMLADIYYDREEFYAASLHYKHYLRLGGDAERARERAKVAPEHVPDISQQNDPSAS